MSNFYDKITNIGKYYSEKVEHKVTDREEFKIVRDTLVRYGMNPLFFDRNLPDLYIPTNFKPGGVVEGSYNARTNSMNSTPNKYALIHELFHMASNNKETNSDLMGVLQKDSKGRNVGMGFNEGITDYFTHLACPEYEPNYPFEERVISIISEIYGIKVFNNHFNANPTEFYNYFEQDKFFIIEISKRLDEYNRAVYQLLDLMSINDFAIMAKKGKALVNSIFNNIVAVCTKLCDLLALKGIDSSRYMGEMRQLFEGSNENMILISSLVTCSDYEDLNGIFHAINVDDNLGLGGRK